VRDSHSVMRKCLALFLAGIAFLLSGCVYLRLLHVKRQLASFDRYFSLDTKDGVRLGCLDPVLLTGDFRWLGITPETTKKLGQSEQWNVRWVKEVAAGASDARVSDVEIELIFTEDKLTRVHIPEVYFSLIPKEFLVGLIRGMGSANINRLQRDAAVNLPSPDELSLARVTATSLAMLLGKPSEQRTEGPKTTLHYRYAPTPPGAKNGIFDIAFIFDTASGQLVLLRGKSPVGQMSFNFGLPDAKKKPGG
jgi:hypothetical protein